MLSNNIYRDSEESFIHVYAGENSSRIKRQHKGTPNFKKRNKKSSGNNGNNTENNHESSASIDIRC